MQNDERIRPLSLPKSNPSLPVPSPLRVLPPLALPRGMGDGGHAPHAQAWLHLCPPNASVPQRVQSGCEHPFPLLCLSHQIPVIWDHILKKNAGKWEAIAKHQVKRVFSPTEEELKLQALR